MLCFAHGCGAEYEHPSANVGRAELITERNEGAGDGHSLPKTQEVMMLLDPWVIEEEEIVKKRRPLCVHFRSK